MAFQQNSWNMEKLHWQKNWRTVIQYHLAWREGSRWMESGNHPAITKKGCLSDCNNWRGITLLSVPGKIFCTVILNRMKSEIDRHFREEGASFRNGRSCNEQIFTLRNILEQCKEFQKSLAINLIDFKKAFDSVHRESIWEILRLYGIPHKIINIFISYLCTPTAYAVSEPKTATLTCLTW